MLIVEGADRVGKTTLCRKLVDRLNQHGPWMYRHFGPLPKSWVHPWDYFPCMGQHVVQDRFHLSEWVYRQAEDQTNPDLTFEKYRLVDAKLRLLGSVTVVLTANRKIIIDRGGNERAVMADGLFRTLSMAIDVDICHNVNLIQLSDDDWFVDKILKIYLERQAFVGTV